MKADGKNFTLLVTVMISYAGGWMKSDIPNAGQRSTPLISGTHMIRVILRGFFFGDWMCSAVCIRLIAPMLTRCTSSDFFGFLLRFVNK